jgi:hypothetical protein
MVDGKSGRDKSKAIEQPSPAQMPTDHNSDQPITVAPRHPNKNSPLPAKAGGCLKICFLR